MALLLKNGWVSFHGHVRSPRVPPGFPQQVGDGGIFMDQVSPAWKVSSRSLDLPGETWRGEITKQLDGWCWTMVDNAGE